MTMFHRLIVLFICLSLFASTGVATAEEIDYSEMSLEELYEIQRQVNLAITDKQEQARKASYQNNDASGEYTFQGIPWGSSPAETLDILMDKGIIDESDTPDSFSNLKWLVEDHEDSYASASIYPDETDTDALRSAIDGQYFFDNIGMQAELTDLNKTFGGLDVGNVTLNYLYGFEDGAVNRESLNLTLVSMYFDRGVTGKQLTEQLCNAYGAYTERDLGSGNVSYRFWYGGDNTVIAAFIFIDGSGVEMEGIGSEPHMIYARTDDYLTAQRILAVQPIKDDVGL